MAGAIITLTTDFGSSSPYVAAMKGVILSINPDATIIDVTHDIPPQDIRAGAIALADTTSRFPAGSIHVAVVDPGVGTNREIVYTDFGSRHYIGPNNGLFTGLARREAPDRIIAIENREFWLPEVSNTFHGRDIMAPVAAHLSLGVSPGTLGSPLNELHILDWPEVRIVPGKIEGSITSIDSFGNLITDITDEMLANTPTDDTVEIVCDEHETRGIFKTYGDQPEMTLMALVGSSGKLELAIVGDSAKIMLGVSAGTPIVVKW